VPNRSNNMGKEPSWSFLTNHARVLICIAVAPKSRMRDLAGRVGITERAVQRIVAELEDGGYLTVTRVGRQNRYVVNTALPLRHQMVAHRTVTHLLELGLGCMPAN
jgi:DNA-binding MarR family transcriptional regulator